jgi:phage tail tape-measure protein
VNNLITRYASTRPTRHLRSAKPSQAGGIVITIAGGFLARELIKFIPALGSAIASYLAAAYTWSLSETACVYFGDLMGGKKPDSNKIQAVMQAKFKEAQGRINSWTTKEHPDARLPIKNGAKR